MGRPLGFQGRFREQHRRSHAAAASPYLGKLVLVPREQPLPSGKCGRAFPQVYEALPFSVADERLLARKLPHLSASRFTAGALGFFDLIQCGERPER